MTDLALIYLCGFVSTAFGLSLSSETMVQHRLVLVWLLMAALWPLTLIWIFIPYKPENSREP